MRWLAIVNPRARKVRNSQIRERWVQQISQVVDDIEETKWSGHATSIARAARAYEGIFVVGGDGTIFEVLQGIDRERQRLAFVGAGGGNSLARDFGVNSLPVAIAALTHGRAMSIDLMHVTLNSITQNLCSYLAASTVAFGYAADVVAKSSRVSGLGVSAYAIAGIVTRPRIVRLRLTAGEADPALRGLTGLIINNTRHIANFHAFPNAVVDDGQFDVAEQLVGWFRQQLHNISMLLRIRKYDPVRRWQTDRLTLNLEQPLTIILDGELVCEVSDVSVSCLPAALTCQVCH